VERGRRGDGEGEKREVRSKKSEANQGADLTHRGNRITARIVTMLVTRAAGFELGQASLLRDAGQSPIPAAACRVWLNQLRGRPTETVHVYSCRTYKMTVSITL
jgi:hypothetical protein